MRVLSNSHKKMFTKNLHIPYKMLVRQNTIYDKSLQFMVEHKEYFTAIPNINKNEFVIALDPCYTC